MATWAWLDRPSRWRDVPHRLRPTVATVARLTAAGVLTYLTTTVVSAGAVDLTGVLTALLVMQASAYATLKMGIVRVGAVLAGVLIASGLAGLFGLTWWSLGTAIAGALFVAKVLRLGEQAIEAPISAMLILGVANSGLAAETRVLNTLIGAGVGVAFNLLYPPALPVRSAADAVLRVAQGTAAPLHSAAAAMSAGPIGRHQVEQWLDEVRAATHQVARANQSVTQLKDARRLNPRALGTLDVEPVLASGLETLEHSLLATRSLFGVLYSELPAQTERPTDPYSDDLRKAFAVILDNVGHSVVAFGELVLAESRDLPDQNEQGLTDSLDVLRETQAMLVELLMLDASPTSSWLLRGSVLAAVDQVLAQLDAERRRRLHDDWREAQRSRPMGHLPPLIEGVLPHPERNSLRGIPPLPPLGRSARARRSSPTNEGEKHVRDGR